ncbi:uncharacterized protein DDB_G0287625-like isoform X2 [Atheta coriaria]|uniref:uncharacterized protein DDB_G0287625-like isoform X2 n=1 Tax=Dalotia coriaria TaxID=877792 RepID=UPI0031F376A0
MSEWNKKQGVIADEPTYDSTNQPRNNNPHRGHSTVYRNSYRNNDNTDYRQEAGNYKRGQHSKPTRNQKSGDWHVSQYGDTDNYKGSRERNSNNKIISHANNQSQLNNENNSSSKRNDWFTQKTDQWKNSNKGYNVRQGQNSTKQTREVSLNPNAGEFTPGFSNEADRSPSTINKIEEHVATTSKPDRYGRTEECVSDTSFLDETTASLNSTSLESSNDDAWNNVIPSSTSGKLQGSKYKNKTTKDVTPLQKDVFKNDNMSLKTSSYEAFEKKYNFLKSNTEYSVVEEIQEDLFALDDSYALGNCVAADLNMGSGIAVGFRQKFKKVDELLAQRQTSGGLAFLIHDDGRYVYYLITKKDSNKKPTYETLYRSLEKLRDNMVENNVKKLGIPRLGCGLDRLEWDKVKPMLEYIFTGTDIKVTVCNFQKNHGKTKQKLQTSSKGVSKDISKTKSSKGKGKNKHRR